MAVEREMKASKSIRTLSLIPNIAYRACLAKLVKSLSCSALRPTTRTGTQHGHRILFLAVALSNSNLNISAELAIGRWITLPTSILHAITRESEQLTCTRSILVMTQIGWIWASSETPARQPHLPHFCGRSMLRLERSQGSEGCL